MKLKWRDVARVAGVSEATVSRVMNGRPGVSERTRRAVLHAAEQLGGGTVSAPRELRLVGVVVPDFANPMFPAFVDLIESRLATEGYTCLLGCATRAVDELQFIEMLAEHGVAGVITISGRHADTEADHTPYADLIADGLSMVLLNGYSPSVPAPFVSCDEREMGRLAVHHLAALGHRRIGIITGPDRYVVVQRRLEGWRDALVDVGADTDDDLVVRSMFTVEGGRAGVAKLIDAGATALISANDLMALGALLGARERGMQVPDDLSVVGSDDSTLMSFTDPPLTSVRQPAAAMCNEAIRLLLEPPTAEPANREFVFLPELIARGTTGAVVTSRRT